MLPSSTLFMADSLPLSEHRTLKNVKKSLKTNIYSYMETSGGQNCNLYLKVVQFFSMPVLIRHLWQLKIVAFLHYCLIRAFLLMTRSDDIFDNFSSTDTHAKKVTSTQTTLLTQPFSKYTR